MSAFIAKAGDIVRLRSGGRTMTVERRVDPVKDPAIAADSDVLVVWMADDGKLQAHWLPDAVLEKADAENEDVTV